METCGWAAIKSDVRKLQLSQMQVQCGKEFVKGAGTVQAVFEAQQYKNGEAVFEKIDKNNDGNPHTSDGRICCSRTEGAFGQVSCHSRKSKHGLRTKTTLKKPKSSFIDGSKRTGSKYVKQTDSTSLPNCNNVYSNVGLGPIILQRALTQHFLREH